MAETVSTAVITGRRINGSERFIDLRSRYFAFAGALGCVPAAGVAPPVSTRTLLFGATVIWPATMTFSPGATPWLTTMLSPCRWPKVKPQVCGVVGFHHVNER